MSTSQVEYYRNEAKALYAQIMVLEDELKLTGIQHKRQALKNKIEVARLQWQVLNLHRENEELRVDALGKAMASQVRIAKHTLESAQGSIAEAGKTTARRLRDLADRLDKNIELGRYEDICYNLNSDLPVILGNSSLDSLARARGEMMAAKALLQIAGGTEE